MELFGTPQAESQSPGGMMGAGTAEVTHMRLIDHLSLC